MILAQLSDPTSYQSFGWICVGIAGVVTAINQVQKALINQKVLNGSLPAQPRTTKTEDSPQTVPSCREAMHKLENADTLLHQRIDRLRDKQDQRHEAIIESLNTIPDRVIATLRNTNVIHTHKS